MKCVEKLYNGMACRRPAVITVLPDGVTSAEADKYGVDRKPLCKRHAPKGSR